MNIRNVKVGMRKADERDAGGGKPRILHPRIEPNLKSATLYPGERVAGIFVHGRKKTKANTIQPSVHVEKLSMTRWPRLS